MNKPIYVLCIERKDGKLTFETYHRFVVALHFYNEAKMLRSMSGNIVSAQVSKHEVGHMPKILREF